MSIYDKPAYLEEIRHLQHLLQNEEKLKNRTFLISGATGMLGSLLTDIILLGNQERNYNCRIIALIRDTEKARRRFMGLGEKEGLYLKVADLSKPFPPDFADSFGTIDYIVHAASNTHPRQYATDPVNTILTNIIGTNNLLSLAAGQRVRRFLFLSSVEIYGENRGDRKLFDETYCGYIDSNTLRAGYPEGKRAGETLCQAYANQFGVDFVTARLARAYGPTLQRSDTKAMSQFLWNALEKKPIVLKSAGIQQYSYIYAGDAVLGILWLLTEGMNGEAYNLSGKDSNVTLKELASIIAALAGTSVAFELPDEIESAGYSKATIAMMDDRKIHATGFEPYYSLHDGLSVTLSILS